MLHTLTTILTGALIASAPIINEPNAEVLDNSPVLEIINTYTEMSYDVSYETCSYELELIRKAALDAGMGMLYEKKEKRSELVINMVIVNEQEDDFELERVVIEKGDSPTNLNWIIDEEGRAIAFERNTVKQEF